MYPICRKSIKYLWLECKWKLWRTQLFTDESSMVRVYIGIKSKGLITQKSVATVDE